MHEIKMRRVLRKKIWGGRTFQKMMQDWHKNTDYQPEKLNYEKEIDNIFPIVPISYVSLNFQHICKAAIQTQNKWEVEDIKIKDIITFQSFLYKKTMNKLKTVDFDDLDQLPIVFNIGRKFCIYDGNHRTATAKLHARESLKMRVVKL